jgi:peptide/nickel transport system ATP-binding protein/oligopeptide transport system ATP-binding protein
MEPILRVQNLQTNFHTLLGLIRAVDRVSFDLMPGERLGIVGESGCGKSVTAQSIMRIVPEPPGCIDGGHIYFGQQDLLALENREMNSIRGNHISMIYQEPMTALNSAYTIGDQVGEVLRYHKGLNKRQAMARTVEMFMEVGIPSPERRVGDYPHQLSGGMRQRVLIAMAIICRPDILIADEPTTALDVTIQSQILELIIHLKEQINTSLILITHDLGVVANMVDRVIVMYAGVIVEMGEVSEIFHQPAHPYTRGLFECIPRLGKRMPRLNEIAGVVPSLLNLPPGCRYSNRCNDRKDICLEREPELNEVRPGHFCRCWLGNQWGRS